jgi:glycosyltransferase involved in cell wall biosynthesis/SAM-dependent methyltransferase
MMEWNAYLHACRSRETDIIFKRCPWKLFGKALELGAGDGFQSRLLSRYASSLISTDIDLGRLQGAGLKEKGVEYRICDAQTASNVFDRGYFDIIFSSSVLEHIQDPVRALRCIHGILKDDGITVHVMPSPFWKFCTLLLRVPYFYLVFIKRVAEGLSSSGKAKDSFSLKKCLYLLPRPHGSTGNPLLELYTFSRYWWRKQFKKAGFDLIGIGKGPVMSGYGFGLEALRSALERSGLSSENIYIAVKKGARSPYQKHFSGRRAEKTITESPRVAMYIWRFAPFMGGAERQCRILAEELSKKGMPVFVVTERTKGTRKTEDINNVRVYRVGSLDRLRRQKEVYRPLFGEQKNKSVVIRRVSRFLTETIPNCYFFLSSLWFFYKRRDQFDIIHVHSADWVACYAVRIARLLRKKIVVKETNAGDFMTFKRQAAMSMKKAAQADMFIAVSTKIFSDLVSLGIPKERIRRIANGVNMDAHTLKWNYDDSDKQSLVCVTKLNQLPNKGIDVLFSALAILVGEHKRSLRLRLVGRGNPAFLEPIADSLGIRENISFLGPMDNVMPCLLSSRLFVLPSRGEGLSNALLEAMSLGIPCVATDISGSQDLIRNRVNGLLVPSENAQALAEAIAFMLDNPAEAARMGLNAMNTIKEGYTMTAVADEYIRLYKELASKHA